jgi:hypothetical protein
MFIGRFHLRGKLQTPGYYFHEIKPRKRGNRTKLEVTEVWHSLHEMANGWFDIYPIGVPQSSQQV